MNYIIQNNLDRPFLIVTDKMILHKLFITRIRLRSVTLSNYLFILEHYWFSNGQLIHNELNLLITLIKSWAQMSKTQIKSQENNFSASQKEGVNSISIKNVPSHLFHYVSKIRSLLIWYQITSHPCKSKNIMS